MRPSVCGLHWAEYVQLWVGRVSVLRSRSGFQILTVPSQEEDEKVVLEVRFQAQEKASRECSEYVAIGKLGSSAVSNRRRSRRRWMRGDAMHVAQSM